MPPSAQPPRQAGCSPEDSPAGPSAPNDSTRLQLATEIPAAILARNLGISVNSAGRWQQISAGDRAGYAADLSTRSSTAISPVLSNDRKSQ